MTEFAQKALPLAVECYSETGGTCESSNLWPPSEWPYDLAEEALGHGHAGDAVVFGFAVPGHVEGAEEDIEEGQARGKVFVEALLLGGVMPAVKNRAGKNVAEFAEGPVEVRMHHGQIGHVEHGQHSHGVGREADEEHQHIHQGEGQPGVDGMKAGSRKPVHFSG